MYVSKSERGELKQTLFTQKDFFNIFSKRALKCGKDLILAMDKAS